MSHAFLSASGSHRWMTCTPSAALEKQFQDSGSEFAAEGTFAHALAELMLQVQLGIIDAKVYKRSLKFMAKDPFYSESMVDYLEAYVALVMERVTEARKDCPDTIVLLEQRLDFSEWVREGYGTGDVIIIADRILEIIDLKYGKGVPVSAIENSQIKLYGLGAINAFELLYDFEEIKMTIAQPRLDNFSTFESSKDLLLNWAETVLKPLAELAWAGEGEYVAGDHCKFCKAKYNCRARAEYNLELAKMDFQKPPLLSDEEIAEVLARADKLKAWVTDIQGFALDQVENCGKHYPGWKLVEGRSTRKYSDACAVAAALIAAGYAEELIYERSLLGITAMEKTIGKKDFGTLLDDLVIKPPGKPVLVPESDKRPPINSAQSAIDDFSETA